MLGNKTKMIGTRIILLCGSSLLDFLPLLEAGSEGRSLGLDGFGMQFVGWFGTSFDGGLDSCPVLLQSLGVGLSEGGVSLTSGITFTTENFDSGHTRRGGCLVNLTWLSILLGDCGFNFKGASGLLAGNTSPTDFSNLYTLLLLFLEVLGRFDFTVSLDDLLTGFLNGLLFRCQLLESSVSKPDSHINTPLAVHLDKSTGMLGMEIDETILLDFVCLSCGTPHLEVFKVGTCCPLQKKNKIVDISLIYKQAAAIHKFLIFCMKILIKKSFSRTVN